MTVTISTRLEMFLNKRSVRNKFMYVLDYIVDTPIYFKVKKCPRNYILSSFSLRPRPSAGARIICSLCCYINGIHAIFISKFLNSLSRYCEKKLQTHTYIHIRQYNNSIFFVSNV